MVQSFISIEDLSSEEQNAVKQLKQRMAEHMEPEMYDDLNVFVRFLRARDLNVNDAETMLKKHIEWRKINQIDTILTNHYTPREVLIKYLPVDVIGIDKEGAPVMYLYFGKMDTRGILKSARKMEILKYFFKKIETAIEVAKKQSIKRGRLIDKARIIIDCEYLSFATATHKDTLQLLGTMIVMYEANYPERLKTLYCINASKYFTMAFPVVKHIISGPTLKKIKIFGKDGWREEFQKLIHPEDLPAFLGGKRTDPDGNPLCKTFITQANLVPTSYYLKNQENSIANSPGVKKLVVTRMSKYHITLDIKECNTDIEWEFETASRDIGFSILYKKDEYDCKLKELVPKQRVESNISTETGMLKCEKPGIYIFVFDNSYSWIFQKEVHYKISVVKNSISVD